MANCIFDLRTFHMGSQNHMSSNSGVEANTMEVVLDRISPSSFAATSWSFPGTDVWIDLMNASYRDGGRNPEDMTIPAALSQDI